MVFYVILGCFTFQFIHIECFSGGMKICFILCLVFPLVYLKITINWSGKRRWLTIEPLESRWNSPLAILLRVGTEREK